MSEISESVPLADGPDERRTALAAGGGLLGAIGVSSCCLLPLSMAALGVSGAWVGMMQTLAPFQPVFLVATLGFLGTGYYLAYRKPKAEGDDCRVRPRNARRTRALLWGATALVVVAQVATYRPELLFGS